MKGVEYFPCLKALFLVASYTAEVNAHLNLNNSGTKKASLRP